MLDFKSFILVSFQSFEYDAILNAICTWIKKMIWIMD